MPPVNTLDFTGKSILIVGASRGGIGSSIARSFAERAALVKITGVEAMPIEKDRDRYEYVQLDVTDDAAVAKLASSTIDLDVLICANGIARRGIEPDLGAFREVLDVNLNGTFACNHYFADALSKRLGCIINIASMYSFFGNPNGPGYASSKAGVASLTRSLAGAYAERGIRVNAVAPGFIRTEQSRPAYENPSHREAVLKRTPMNRWGEPDDIVGPVLFLASPLARFVTGAIVPVDGGYSAI